jgi:hypothetical protein
LLTIIQLDSQTCFNPKHKEDEVWKSLKHIAHNLLEIAIWSWVLTTGLGIVLVLIFSILSLVMRF